MKRYVACSSQDYDDFDVFHGYTYMISGDDDIHRPVIKYTNDPKQAIAYWFKIGKTHPYTTSIMTRSRSDASKLCQTATRDMLEDLYQTYGCPYKLDYLVDSCENFEPQYFYENDMGDQIHPFGVG